MSYWLHIGVLAISGAVVFALGVNAYYRHKCESTKAVSMRVWMYWTYAVAFGGAAVAAVVELCLVIVFPARAPSALYISLFSLLLALSYLVLLAGVKRGTFR